MKSKEQEGQLSPSVGLGQLFPALLTGEGSGHQRTDCCGHKKHPATPPSSLDRNIGTWISV